jgi:hypothetical protein
MLTYGELEVAFCIARTRVQARRSPGNRSSVGNRVPFSKSIVVVLEGTLPVEAANTTAFVGSVQ